MTAEHPRPNFLFIGGARCGSKSLHRILQQHPDCFVPAIADPYYFDRHYGRGPDWYLSLFAGAPASALAIGELSHDYLHSATAAQRIATDFPDTRILVTLRNPIERTFSSFMSRVSAGLVAADLLKAVELQPDLVEHSMYADLLQPYLDLFPRDRIKILFFDDLAEDPSKYAKDVFDFLGLSFLDSIEYGKKVSALSRSRFPGAGWLSKRAANLLRKVGWVNLLGSIKSNPYIRGMFYVPYSDEEKPTVTLEARQKLAARFEPQIEALERLTGRDLAAWR